MNSNRFVSHSLWIEGPPAWARLPRIAMFFLLSVAMYSSGLVVSLLTGILGPYVSSPAFLIGSLGIAWVFTAIPWQARKIDRLYTDAIKAFDDSPQAMTAKVRDVFDTSCDWRGHLFASAVIFLAFSAAAFCAFFSYPFTVLGVELTSLRPAWFTAGIYAHAGGIPGFVVVVWFAALIAVALGTAIWLMVGEIRLLPYLASRMTPPLPEAVRAKLRGIADFHVQIARDWSIGAVSFLLLFSTNADAGSLAFVGLLLGLGIVVFFVPQLYLRQIVLRAHRRATDIALEAWRDRSLRSGHNSDSDADLLATLSETTSHPNYWVYGSGQLSMWIIAQLTAVAALTFQLWDIFKPS